MNSTSLHHDTTRAAFLKIVPFCQPAAQRDLGPAYPQRLTPPPVSSASTSVAPARRRPAFRAFQSAHLLPAA